MSAPERAVARIDLGAIERNCAHLKSLLARGARLCAVVKADGYGHGDVWCARAALDGGADWLAVATAAEAEELRRHGIRARILVMGALTREDARVALAAAADVVAWDERFVAILDEIARADDLRANVHVKLDTGMGRLGAKDAGEARAVALAVEAAAPLDLSGVDDPLRDGGRAGRRPLRASARALRAVRRRAAQGAQTTCSSTPRTARPPTATSARTSTWCAAASRSTGSTPSTRIRPSADSSPPCGSSPTSPRSGSSSRARARATGAAGRRSEPTYVGTLPIGYGDGWRRGLTNNADVLVRGRRYPLVGTVSMDNITIDLGPETEVVPGDRAVLIGEDGGERILCEDVARRLDTINYEITCGLSQRVRRAHGHL